MSEPLNKMQAVRKALQHTLSDGYAEVTSGRRARVLEWPIGKTDFPAILVTPDDPWLSRIEDEVTFCTHIVRFRLFLMCSQPAEPGTWDTVEDMAAHLPAVLKLARKSELWEPNDGKPILGDVNRPDRGDYQKIEVLYSEAEVSVQVHL